MRITLVFDADSAVEFTEEMVQTFIDHMKESYTRYEAPIISKFVSCEVEARPEQVEKP